MNFQTVAEAHLCKFNSHLGCLSERLYVLSLFSSNMNVAEKKILCKTLLKQKMLPQPHNQYTPVVTCTTHLKDMVGQDSWTLFQLLGLPTTFLRESPATWINNDDYINSCEMVMNLVVANDVCEKAFGLLAEFKTNKITTSQTQKQFLYKLVTKLQTKSTN